MIRCKVNLPNFVYTYADMPTQGTVETGYNFHTKYCEAGVFVFCTVVPYRYFS